MCWHFSRVYDIDQGKALVVMLLRTYKAAAIAISNPKKLSTFHLNCFWLSAINHVLCRWQPFHSISNDILITCFISIPNAGFFFFIFFLSLDSDEYIFWGWKWVLICVCLSLKFFHHVLIAYIRSGDFLCNYLKNRLFCSTWMENMKSVWNFKKKKWKRKSWQSSDLSLRLRINETNLRRIKQHQTLFIINVFLIKKLLWIVFTTAPNAFRIFVWNIFWGEQFSEFSCE